MNSGLVSFRQAFKPLFISVLMQVWALNAISSWELSVFQKSPMIETDILAFSMVLTMKKNPGALWWLSDLRWLINWKRICISAFICWQSSFSVDHHCSAAPAPRSAPSGTSCSVCGLVISFLLDTLQLLNSSPLFWCNISIMSPPDVTALFITCRTTYTHRNCSISVIIYF